MKLNVFAFAWLATHTMTTALGQNKVENQAPHQKRAVPFHRFSISTPYLSLINF